MDLVSSCKEKLAYFRLKELKDVLGKLGLAKQGKKQDLMDRVLGMLSDEQGSKAHSWAKKNSIGKEGVAKIIDDTYRKMGIPGASDLASSGHSGSDTSKVKFKEEVDDSFQFNMNIRCPCGNSLSTDSLIQCEDPKCHVWQHMSCVIIPEKPMDGTQPERPPRFYCEICRVSRADPFWLTMAHPLYPVKLTTASLPTDGTNPVQNVEKTFQLTRADRDLLQRAEYEVQAWCMLLNDKVLFRMHWPQYADLQVNGVSIRTTNRPGTQLLGANGRDDGPAIKTCTREGINKISLSGCDARIFCLGVRIVKRRTVQQVLSIILKNTDGEPFEDALTRVRRCIGGGNSKNDADSDSDVEVVADSITVNLRCPMSASRVKTAGRFKPCAHMGGFDLETFVELNQRSRKWQCPICLKNYSLEDVIVDQYFNRITNMLRECGEDVTEIDVRPDGSWRAKNENERLDLLQWHLPDGSVCAPTDKEMKSVLEFAKQIKQEGASDGYGSLKLGIKKNQNGLWEVSKPEEMRSLSSGPLELKCDKNGQKAIPMSSSATGSCRGSEDMSVNQDDGGQSHFSANNGNKQDAISCNFDATYGVANGSPAPVGNADVIVLSDSDDENGNLISSDNIYASGRGNANGIPFPVTSEVPGSYPEDPGVGTASLGLFNGNETGISWPMQSGTSAGSAFELFGAADVSDTFVGLPHTSDPCSQSMNGYASVSDAIVTSAAQDPYAGCPSSTERSNNLVNNSLFNGDDSSMQIFLPSYPAVTPVQGDTRDQPDISEGIRTEDWISLSLGGGGGSAGGQGESGVANDLNYGNQVTSKDGRLESLANTASLVLSMNGNGSDKMGKEKRSEGPFSYPRQPRSVRPRLYLSIDSD